jgi:hypothetical protein
MVMAVQQRESSVDDAQQHGERCGFGRGGHERDHRRGRAFIDVGRPDVEGRGRNLEAEPDDEHGQADVDDAGRVAGGDGGGNLRNARASGGAEDERDAVEEERRRERAEQEVFQRRFRAFRGFTAVPGHDVRGDRRDFQRDEDQQQLDGTGHEHHADGAEENQREQLAQTLGGVADRVQRDQQRGEHDAGDEDMEEDAEGVGADDAVEGVSGGQRGLPETGAQCGQRSADGEPAQRLAAGRLRDGRVSQHDKDAEDGEDDFRQRAQGRIHGVHRAPPCGPGADGLAAVAGAAICAAGGFASPDMAPSMAFIQ